MKRNKLDMKQQENNDLKKYKNLKRTQKKYSIMAQCLEFVDPNEEKCLPIRAVSGSKLEVFSRHSKKRIKQQFDYNLQCKMQSKKKCKLPNIRTNFDDVKEDQTIKINKFYKQDKYNQLFKADSIREDIFSEIQQQQSSKICSLHSDKQSKQNENKQPILQIKCIRKRDTNTALITAYSQTKNKLFNKQKQQRHKNKFNINVHTQKESFKDRKNKKNSQIKGNSSENNSLKKNKRSITLTLKAVKQPKMSSEYHDFGRLICLLQKLKHSQEPIGSYKAYVGRGNNSILIKNTIKNRFWWTISDNELDSNLQWSQNRDMKILGCLKPLQIISKQQKFHDKFSSLQIKQFNMQTSKDNQKNQKTRQYTQIGFYKLLSQQERKNYAYNQFHLEIICNNLSQIRNIENPNRNRMHNHLQFNWHLCNKKALYYNLKAYYQTIKQDPFEYIPLTFHIQQYGDNQWQAFKIAYQNRIDQLSDSNRGKKKKNKNKNLWIIKPGQNSNQGCGIQLCQNIIQIQQIIQKKTNKNNNKKRSHIIQKYLNPFLYNKRKFDIRTYILITSLNNNIRAYWYQQGYIRTSSKQYNIKNIKNKMIHLTNDAVQKKSQDYGKYENGNKISFGDFQKYLDLNQNKMDFYTTIYPKMIKLAHDAVKSIHTVIDNKYRQYTFELFGLDFMIDQEFQTWLIEVNNNPCMQLSSPLLARIIPNMMENTLRIAVDPIFPPPKEYSKIKNISTDLFENNKFTLIFNSQDQSEKYNIVSCQKNLQNIIESDEYQDQHEQQEKE